MPSEAKTLPLLSVTSIQCYSRAPSRRSRAAGALLAVAAAIEDTGESAAEDIDAATATLAERVTRFEDVIDAATAVLLLPARRGPFRTLRAWARAPARETGAGGAPGAGPPPGRCASRRGRREPGYG